MPQTIGRKWTRSEYVSCFIFSRLNFDLELLQLASLVWKYEELPENTELYRGVWTAGRTEKRSASVTYLFASRSRFDNTMECKEVCSIGRINTTAILNLIDAILEEIKLVSDR